MMGDDTKGHPFHVLGWVHLIIIRIEVERLSKSVFLFACDTRISKNLDSALQNNVAKFKKIFWVL